MADLVPPVTQRRRRVLIIEDNQDVADMLSLMLADWGDIVKLAYDPVAGLRIGAEFRPDVVLLDLGMPRLHGFEVARRIREQPWGAAVTLIAVTGWGQEADRAQSRAAGIKHHLVKPVDPELLRGLLQEIEAGAD